MNLLIAIDGACRRNGKPDCTSSGGVFIQTYNNCELYATDTIAVHEYNSTNQRGELLALLECIRYIGKVKLDALVVTDSEYLFNAMTKPWYTNWINNNWCTRAGEPVKNSDIWKDIVDALEECKKVDITFYHVKGHCIPFGRVTANNLLEADTTGLSLYEKVQDKFDAVAPTKEKVFCAAFELSERNNGFMPAPGTFKLWVSSNVVADAIATREVEAADQRS